MFTMKLYRRRPETGEIVSKIFTIDHIRTIEIGKQTLHVQACPGVEDGFFEDIFLGLRTPEMTALTDENHWEWGLLENMAGKTTQHFRPYTYG